MKLSEYRKMLEERAAAMEKAAADSMKGLSGQPQSTIDFAMRTAAGYSARSDELKRVLKDLETIKKL